MLFRLNQSAYFITEIKTKKSGSEYAKKEVELKLYEYVKSLSKTKCFSLLLDLKCLYYLVVVDSIIHFLLNFNGASSNICTHIFSLLF